MKQSNTFKRLGTGVVLTAFLVCCFFGATFTLRPAYADWEAAPANSLNGGKIVISEIDQKKFEPGATIERPFTVGNLLTDKDVYYVLFFDVTDDPELLPGETSLADVLDVSIYYADDLDNPVVSGKMSDLNRNDITAMVKNDNRNQPDMLVARIGEEIDERSFVLQIHYPETAGNDCQKQSIVFDFRLGFATELPTTQ